jgi:hypothetical protein
LFAVIRAPMVAATVAFALPALTPSTASALAPYAFVLTQHNDVARSGWNSRESIITPSTIGSLHKLLDVSLPRGTGQIVGQLLYLPAIELDGTFHTATDLIIATTTLNWVFAYDATGPGTGLKWQTHLSSFGDRFNSSLTSPCNPDSFGGHTQRFNGITATPAAGFRNDGTDAVIYVVEKVVPTSTLTDCWNTNAHSPTPFPVYFRLWGLNAHNGSRLYGPVIIGGPNQVIGPGNVVFHPSIQNNRPGLLAANSSVYVAFGGLPNDGEYFGVGHYHGWVMRFPFDLSTTLPTKVYVTTPTGGEGGIWQAGNGLAYDVNSNSLFFATGNGTYDGSGNLGDSIVRLDATQLTVTSKYSPPNRGILENKDMDLGSAGPILIGTPYGTQVLQGGKEGVFTSLDLNLNLVQSFRATVNEYRSCLQQMSSGGGFDYPHIRGSPAFDGHTVYVWAQSDGLEMHPVIDIGGHYGFNLFQAGWTYCQNTSSPVASGNCTVGCSRSPTGGDPDDNYNADIDTRYNGDVLAPDGESGGAVSLSGLNSSTGGASLVWGSLNAFGGPQDGNPPAPTAEEDYQWGLMCTYDAATFTDYFCNSGDSYVWAKFVPPTVAGGRVFLPGLVWDGTTHGPFRQQPGTTGDSQILIYGVN